MKKTKVQLDIDGNEVIPFTKEVIRPLEKEYVPTPEELKSAASKPPSDAKPKDALIPPEPEGPLNIEALISKKIEALIEKKVNDVLEKMLK